MAGSTVLLCHQLATVVLRNELAAQWWLFCGRETICELVPPPPNPSRVQRSGERTAFGAPLYRHQSVRLDIAQSRIELDAAR